MYSESVKVSKSCYSCALDLEGAGGVTVYVIAASMNMKKNKTGEGAFRRFCRLRRTVSDCRILCLRCLLQNPLFALHVAPKCLNVESFVCFAC